MLPVAVFGQKIEGIGPFKIGKTTTIIFDSLKNNHYSYSESPDWFYILTPKRTRSITLLIEDTTGFIRNSKTKRTKDVKVYNIGAVDQKGPQANNLILNFYKDTLCSIISNDYQSDFMAFIKGRVGLPKDTIHRTNSNCSNLRNPVNENTISTYTNQPGLRILEVSGFYFDKQCIKKWKHFFEISNPVIMKKLSQSSGSFDIIFPYFFL